MNPKRGQPPKPLEKQRKNRQVVRYSDIEMTLLHEAYALSESKRPFLRWLANVTLEEARKIVDSHRK